MKTDLIEHLREIVLPDGRIIGQKHVEGIGYTMSKFSNHTHLELNGYDLFDLYSLGEELRTSQIPVYAAILDFDSSETKKYELNPIARYSCIGSLVPESCKELPMHSIITNVVDGRVQMGVNPFEQKVQELEKRLDRVA